MITPIGIRICAVLWHLIGFASGLSVVGDKTVTVPTSTNEKTKIKIAIVGAGQVGASLAEDLVRNPNLSYLPCCFIDIDHSKIGREVAGIPVLSNTEATPERLAEFPIQEIVFALPHTTPERKKELYQHYKKTGCKLKVYDYPVMQTAETGKRHLREFDIEELLFRQLICVSLTSRSFCSASLLNSATKRQMHITKTKWS